MIFQTKRLIIRNWEAKDVNTFHRLCSDKRIMEFIPYCWDRLKAGQMMDMMSKQINENGFGFAAVELKNTRQLVGFCGLKHWHHPPQFNNTTIEIGWRLLPEHWGHGYITESASTWLQYGFSNFEFKEIVSFTVPQNTRSIAVMKRIGLKRDPSRDFDHSKVPDQYPHLKPHIVYYATSNQNDIIT